MADASASAPPPDSHQFGNIVLGGKDAHRDENVGTLKVHGDGLGWKSRKAGNVVVISKADLRTVEWIKIPHACQLKVRAKGGFVYKFNGFRSQDKETVREYVSATFGLEIEDTALSYKGWNWGQTVIEGGNVCFNVEGKQTLEMPLTDISQATAQKNEAVLEMVTDDTALPEDELLVEVRFHIPAAMGEEVDVDGTPAEHFVETIKQSGDLEVAGASLVTLEEMPLQVPRGRYDVEMCDKFMKLHGKSNDYKVLYNNVSGLYLLPKHDAYHMLFCISLEHPLRQGATSYPHIVLQLPRDQMTEVEIGASEAEVASRFGDKLDKFESGDMPSVVSKVVSAFTKKKVVGIKAGGFNGQSSDDRSKSIRCSLKAAEGHLFPLDKAFFFIANKPQLIEFDRIASVEFNRVEATQQAARTFDITVHVKDSSGDLQFVNLPRSDYKELFRFLTSKKIRIKNIAASSFEDDRRGGDDEDDDPYMATVRREREEAVKADLGDEDDDDDDDEDDEDFKGGGESDVDEEFDEGSESDEDRMEKKGKKKREKGSDDGSGSDDDAGSGSDSEEKPLKKPKTEKAPKAEKAKKSKLEEGGKKKKRAKKDKNEPKRGLSAYMLWMNGAGRNLAKEAGETGIGPIGKWCGAKWKAMEGEEKGEWEEKAKEDKERYLGEMSAYKAKARAEAVAAAADDSDDDDDDAASAKEEDSD